MLNVSINGHIGFRKLGEAIKKWSVWHMDQMQDIHPGDWGLYCKWDQKSVLT